MTSQEENRRAVFPVLAAVILFGVFAVLLVLLLAQAGLVREAQDAIPLPTSIPAELGAAPTVPVAEATDVLGADTAEPTAESTAAGVAALPTASSAQAEAGAEGAAQATAEAVTGVVGQPVLDPAVVAEGLSLFNTTCTACHGQGAIGIQGLGKTLVDSPFVQGLTDEELAHFIITGRPMFDPANTTGIEMPARGGNPMLSDDQVDLIVQYIRSLQSGVGIEDIHADVVAASTEALAEVAPSPGEVVAVATLVPEAATPAPAATQSAASDAPAVANVPTFPPPGIAEATAQPYFTDARGAYTWACAQCHGADGQGVPGFAASLEGNAVAKSGDAQQLHALLTEGELPAYTDGEFVHPFRGGYPPLTDAQIADLAAFLQTLVAGG